MSLEVKKILFNASWLSIALGLGQVINFASIIFAAKFLGPDQYGVYATGLIVVAFASIIARFGIMDALVQRNIDSETASTAYMISIMLSLIALIITSSASILFYFLGNAYQATITFGLSFSAVFLGLQTVYEAILRRSMNFRKLSLIRLAATIGGSLTLVLFIYIEPTSWALVAQRVGVELVALCLLILTSSLKIKYAISKNKAKELFSFGKGVGLANFADVTANQVDQILVRIIWGEVALGLYAMAKRLIGNVQQLMFLPFRQVSIAGMANISKDVDKITAIYIKWTRVIVFISILVVWLIYLSADSLIAILFSETWDGAVELVQVLCWIIIYDSFIIMYPAILHSFKKVNWLFQERLTRLFVGIFSLLMFANTEIGVIGATYSVIIQSLVTLPLVMFYVSKILGTNSLRSIIDFIILSLLSYVDYIILHFAGIRYSSSDSVFYNLIEYNIYFCVTFVIFSSIYYYIKNNIKFNMLNR